MNIVLARQRPPDRQASGHAKGTDDVRVLAQRVRQDLSLSVAFCRYLSRAPRLPFGQQCHGDDGPRPAGRDDADRRMKEE